MTLLAVGLGFGAALGLAVAGIQTAAPIRVVIQPSQVRFVCADGGLTSAAVSLDITIENAGTAPYAVPARGLDFGSERYWVAGADPELESEPAVRISGVLVLTSGPIREATRTDFVVVAPSARHIVKAEKNVVVARTGPARDGILVPGRYSARLQAGSRFMGAQSADTRRRLERTLAPFWEDFVWSEPFGLAIPPVPDGLPTCAA